MYDLLIINANVITPREYKPNHDIAIQGNKIEAILPTGQINTDQARQLIDASDMIAMPGFINTHCHIAMVLFRGAGEDITIDDWFNKVIWPLESNLTPEDVYWGTQLGLAEMIEAGVTTVADHYFYMDEVAKAIDLSGMRANLVWAMFSAGVADPLAKLDETTAFVDRWDGRAEGRITTWLGPHAPYTCDNDFLTKVAERAKSLNVGLHIHAAETTEQIQASLSQHGKTPFGVLRDTGILDVPTIIAHAAQTNDEDIQIIKAAGAGVAHCPKTYLKLASGVTPVVKMRAAGVPVGIGSDGAVSNNTLDILEQTRIAAMMQKHQEQNPELLTLDDAFDMAFAGGAKVLHMDNIGELAAGKLADLILIRTDSPHMQPAINPKANVLYSAQGNDIDTVICNGKILMRQRQLLTLDKKRIFAEVNARLGRLLNTDHGQRIQTYKI